MGSCVSVHKGKPGSEMKLGLSKYGSKADRAVVLPESPIKDSKPASVDLPANTFDDFGSKDETFFDSRAWLDSDCEDDFFSVNGDFTPSRGSTPVHHRFSTGTPQVNKTPLAEGSPSSIPAPRKKRLSELFRDSSVREQQDVDEPQTSGSQNIADGKTEVKPTILDVLPRSAHGTPYNSASCSERIANGEALVERETSIKSLQCCLPSLISCRSLSGRKKRMSPAMTVSGKA